MQSNVPKDAKNNPRPHLTKPAMIDDPFLVLLGRWTKPQLERKKVHFRLTNKHGERKEGVGDFHVMAMQGRFQVTIIERAEKVITGHWLDQKAVNAIEVEPEREGVDYRCYRW